MCGLNIAMLSCVRWLGLAVNCQLSELELAFYATTANRVPK